MTRFYSGEHIAKMWRPPAQSGRGGPGGAHQPLCRKCGEEPRRAFSLFTDEESALRWLLPTSDVPDGQGGG